MGEETKKEPIHSNYITILVKNQILLRLGCAQSKRKGQPNDCPHNYSNNSLFSSQTETSSPLLKDFGPTVKAIFGKIKLFIISQNSSTFFVVLFFIK